MDENPGVPDMRIKGMYEVRMPWMRCFTWLFTHLLPGESVNVESARGGRSWLSLPENPTMRLSVARSRKR